MKPHARGAVQDPMPDYHDTNRPEHEETPASRQAKTGVSEKSNSHLANELPTETQEPVMSHSTTSTPPANWTPEHDTDGSVLYFDGPSATVCDAAIFTEWTPEGGVVIRDSNGHEIPLDDLVPFACRVLKVHSEVLRLRRETR